MPKTVDRLGCPGPGRRDVDRAGPHATAGLDAQPRRLPRRAASGTLRSSIPPVTTAAWTTMMTGCGPAQTWRLRPSLLRCCRRPDESQSLGPHPRPDGLATALRHRPVDRLPELPGLYPPLKVPGIVVSGMDAPHLEAALAAAPEFAARREAEAPGYGLGLFWKRAPSRSKS